MLPMFSESISTATALVLRHFREVGFQSENKKLHYRKPKLRSSYITLQRCDVSCILLLK